jgi:hypothetical protein
MAMLALVQIPGLTVSTQEFMRFCYGALLLATLALTLGPSRWFFVSERFGGYAKSDPWTDRIQNPKLLPAILAVWAGCAVLLVLGRHTVVASLVNLLLCRYFFIHMRWKGVLRGMGAPGFMTYWLGACVFFLEYGLHLEPSGTIRSIALLLFRIDFAAIMISAGVYKLVCGYPRSQGMELGMVNPWWGYWWRFYKQMPPRHVLFRFLNHMAYGTEIVAGLLMLVPVTQVWGAWLISLSFIFIASQIRLGFLCEMVIVSCLIFMVPGSVADQMIGRGFAAPQPSSALMPAFLAPLHGAVAGLLLIYIALLPLAHAGLWYNFLVRKSLPAFWQKCLERYSNFFGIIIWRVFTVDVINFFANIYVLDAQSGARRLYSRFDRIDWASRLRYRHVGEFVCLASLFTTLKYYPSNRPLFDERLLRYARTIPCPRGSHVLFELVSIEKTPNTFEFKPVLEYAADIATGRVSERVLDPSYRFRVEASPIHEAQKPGSYAPAPLVQ